MDRLSDAAGWEAAGAGDEPGRSRAPGARAEALVTPLAVLAVAVAGVLAALMQTRADATHARAAPAAPACADCGVVEAVMTLAQHPPASSAAYRMRIRMDDGSLRTVEQRPALAAGSRVTLAGGSVRALPGRPGQG